MSSRKNQFQPADPNTATVASGRIAIIGVSGRYPNGANSPDLLWQTLKSGVDAVTETKGDRWDLGWHHPDTHRAGRVYTRSGGFLDRIDGFDAEFFGLSPREVRQVDPQQRLLLELAWEAHEDAGIAPRSRAGSDTGVFVGISSNDYASLGGQGWPDAYSNTGSSFSIAANRISYIFDFHGPSVAVDTACSSSIVCVHQACMALLNGECSTALAGGVSILMHIRPWLGFARASMLSPTGRCKSFDASGDGYVRSEGGGLVLLKPLAAAERDGDRILGVILASGVNSDGRTMGLSMPNGDAQEKLLRKVYGQSGVDPAEVFYVEAHGTGTAVGDPIECGALGRVLGAPRTDGSKCLIGSVKSNIGHLEAASGIAGLTKVVLLLKHRMIPGNLHFKNPNPKIDFENWKLGVVTEPTALPSTDKPVIVGINSFGFGGTNAHLAISEYRPPVHQQGLIAVESPKPNPNILMLSGHSEAGLKAVARQYIDLLRTKPEQFKEICAAAAICRSMLRHRLAVSGSNAVEVIAKLESYLNGKNPARLATGNVGNAAGSTDAPIAFVYSGNGPQWWGMGRELLAENAIFRAELEAVDKIFSPLAGWSLIAEMARPEAESRIALTEVAQPMLFALQLGLTQVLRSQGINPAAVLGHSVGEAAAAWACGALSREQATQVIFHRSREQAKTAGHGKMAALGVSASDAQTAMAAIPGWLELAAINSPSSVTVAGDPLALQQLVDQMTTAGKFARVLPLNYPFHTKAMDPIRAGLVESLVELTPSDSSVDFISTVDGKKLDVTALNAEYWFRNVREPVQFSQAVTELLKVHGIALFLEIGPHPVLKDYVVQAARAAEISAVALQTLRRPGRQGPEPESDNLSTAICAAYANGAARLEHLFTRPNPIPELPLYPWQRERHWRGGVILPDIFDIVQKDHPLLGHRIPALDGVWENTADTNQLGYLKDHVVQQSVLFPAAGYIECALSAGQFMLGKGILDVENFEILRPMAIPAHGDPLMQTVVDAKDGTVQIGSKADRDTAEWTIHARGRLSRGESKANADALDLAAIRTRTVVPVGKEEHYKDSSSRGLDYGPTFQGIANVLLTAPNAAVREALAQISLPVMQPADLAHYLAHPSLLDSCIQILITLIAQNEKRNCSPLPVQLGRVRSFAPLTGEMFCHVVMRRESARSAVADFRVTDAEGNLLLSIEQARCQKVNFQQAGAAPLTSEWWRPDLKAIALSTPVALELPKNILDGMQLEVGRIANDAARPVFYQTIRPAIEKLVGAYAIQAIRSFNPEDAAFELSQFARKAGIKRDQATLLATLVRMAEQDGQLVRSGTSYTWNKARKPQSPDALWADLFRHHPRYQAELLLIAHAGANLPAKLRGEEIADTNSGLMDQLQDTAPFQASYNQIARSVVEKLLAKWPADRPVRVLDISGNGGGLASWIMPVLPAERADYLFTDPTDAALGRVSHRLSSHRFARFEVLDLSREFTEQGISPGYFDLVIGSNAVGTSKNPREVLSRIQTVMAPGAHLLLIEAHKDRFTDLVLDQHMGVLSDDLSAAGFEKCVEFDDAAACPEGQLPQQSLLLAQCSVVSVLPTDQVSSDKSRRWMLVVEEGENTSAFSVGLVHSLAAHQQSVTLRSFVDPAAELKDAITAALKDTPVDEVVYIAAPGNGGADLLATQKRRSLVALNLVQVLESVRQEMPCSITLVTRGGFPTANGQGPLDPAQAPLWGLGRVIGNELSGLNIRSVDLHSTLNNREDASWLAAELLRRDGETEVQLTAGHRYVNRERITHLTDEARHAGCNSAAFALDFLPQGGLDSLHLRSIDRKEPAANQVEIAVKAAGLNFRDVLWSMGMLPEEAVEHGFSGPTIGMECSGEIVRVGSAVTHVKPGDRVVAFASSCFASHVTTDAGSVAVIPDNLEYAAAATIPTAFLTAYYAFDYLARLEPGETVLIHGAAGGVGIAAIQIARLKGAIVIGTAGSVRKRNMLKMLGVDHVLNSRSLEFADQVMKLTGGVGVDVVLNSLAGEAITKSLQCLRPFGRFLEIGKRDLYANSRIGLRPFRNNLSYFGIDADTLLIERADLARMLFKRVVEHFAKGELQPLPFQEIPISRASEAFRAMQQSKHVGKLVVSTRLDKPESLVVVPSATKIKPNATYLVTGGLGGFGLSTAKWLVEQGATSLALLSRRGASTDEAITGLAELQHMGALVRGFAADIGDADSLASVLKVIRAEMPPLTGIIHSAAVIEDAPIVNLGEEQLDRVYRPKLIGAWNLHRQTLNDPIDLFVLYSSSSAVVGNPGQGAYVAANLYLDALALHRRAMGLPALSVGWGAIKDAGFLTRHQAVAGMLKTRTGLDATPAGEALADLGRLLTVGSTRVSVARFDLQRLGQMLPGARVPRFLPIIPKGAADSLAAEETLGDLLKKVPAAEHRAFVLARVRGHAARVLGTSAAQVNTDQPLSDLGLDSLMAVELAGGIERDLGQPVSVMQMLTAGSLNAIAELVMKIVGVAVDEAPKVPVVIATKGLQEARA
jgi:acyl transferase domain-containing protein/acyl carrier protein